MSDEQQAEIANAIKKIDFLSEVILEHISGFDAKVSEALLEIDEVVDQRVEQKLRELGVIQ